MPDNLTHGNVCDFDFYVVNFNGGKAKLPTDTPDKFHLSLHEALDEFKRQCAVNPANYTTAVGVDFTVHEENRDLNAGYPVGSIDFAHFKDGKLKILDDYEQDRVIQKEYSLKVNTLNFIKRETADLMPKIPFYDKSVDYAKENGELDKWRESMWENRRCAKEIENLIAEFHDGSHLASDSIIDGALKQFSEERVTLVLASTVQNKSWDGRFSQSNKDWAAGIDIPDNGKGHEIQSDAHPALLDGVISSYRKHLIELEKNLTENKSAERTQGGTSMAEHNTTFEVSSMTQLENAGNVKALANVVINGEIAVNGVKVVEGKNGLFAAMPNKKIGGEYVDIAHTTTTEAYNQLNEAVVSTYEQLALSGEKSIKNDLGLDKGKAVTSQLDVSLHAVGGSSSVVAAGQVQIDDCFVIKDVKVIKPADKPEFASMPSYQNQNGKYVDIANPITTAMHKTMNETVIDKLKAMEQVQYRGVKYAELGDKSEIAALPKQNNKYAEKLMSELDKAGVVYQARIGSNSGTTISVNAADKPRLDSIHKELQKTLNPEQPKQENKPPKHGRH